jgi:hypothetical protein
MLQELNPSSADILRKAAKLDWIVRAVDLRPPQDGVRAARSRAVAIAGHGPSPSRSRCCHYARADPDLRRGDRWHHADGSLLPRPPGVTWVIVKPRQAVAFASWLAARSGAVIVGVDANTPEMDAPKFAMTRTHWHTGRSILTGALGDDLVFGAAKIHDLDDAPRVWLAYHPDQAAAIAPEQPVGPWLLPTTPASAKLLGNRSPLRLHLDLAPLDRHPHRAPLRGRRQGRQRSCRCYRRPALSRTVRVQ